MAPILSIGQESVTRACRRIGSAMPLGFAEPGSEGCEYLYVLNVQCFNAGCRPCLQLWSFTGNRDESSARLLPGHRLGRGTGVEGRLDKKSASMRVGSLTACLSRASLCGTWQRCGRHGLAHSDVMQRQHPDSS